MAVLPRLAGLSLAVGVAVARALENCGVPGIGLKWPNDILLDGGKLGGILVELDAQPDGMVAVMGIGLNPAAVRCRRRGILASANLVVASLLAPARSSSIVGAHPA
ncbi:MAG: hypothetical protein IPN78_19010 [Candidatus Accumulibacter sp.]|nr:hypothetical protein [Candidatus Accumulibacter propinquus]